jgi:hypothetical protein
MIRGEWNIRRRGVQVPDGSSLGGEKTELYQQSYGGTRIKYGQVTTLEGTGTESGESLVRPTWSMERRVRLLRRNVGRGEVR